jgi:hypothetical protein
MAKDEKQLLRLWWENGGIEGNEGESHRAAFLKEITG